MKYVFVLLFLLMSLFSCSEKDLVRRLSVKDKVSEFSDTLFLGRVKNLLTYNNDIYFVEQYRNQIIKLDSCLNLRGLIGRMGEGPEELCNVSSFIIDNDIIYVLDAGCAKLISYGLDGNIIARYRLSEKVGLMPEFRFVVSGNDYMEMSVTDRRGAFGKMKLQSDSVSYWGERTLFAHTDMEYVRNGRYLFKSSFGYVSISDNEAIIEVYNFDKKKIMDYDYSSLEVVKRSLAYLDTQPMSSNSYGIICEDAYMDGNQIYLLLSSYETMGYKANTVAVFELQSDIRLKGVYQLAGSLYSSLCVLNGNVYAFETKESILEKYSIMSSSVN
ncbi:MAG: 6-bladed beta-propeller [Bacteroides acidifaciens]|uniref:6-bladed beta-propeller n=1 Tax=Bacteroides acidifaciens TaxID=85831 RepID=UPI0023CFC116|nr:6-bladed beta-propeller [Bacteroides acidifaciens]MDE6821868.1 6-bladed beta-propeller [Bacteroides acidifaciens]MDE6988683.1 6-bladed beta-propeller [Bacteroides acidifaciens]